MHSQELPEINSTKNNTIYQGERVSFEYEQSQNTILLASTQAVYKAPHSTVRSQSVIIIGAGAVATVVVGVSERKA